ncbi:7169_t:CDS:2, partial [Gigaspora margarita]
QNGDIIIYGGALWNDTNTLATPYIAKLDTNTWMWSIPNLSQINSPQLYLFIGIGIGASIVLFGVFSVVGFLLCKRKKQNQYPKFIPTP